MDLVTLRDTWSLSLVSHHIDMMLDAWGGSSDSPKKWLTSLVQECDHQGNIDNRNYDFFLRTQYID